MKIEIKSDGQDIFVVVDNVKVAKRGRPDTPQAKMWISLQPGWQVFDSTTSSEIVIEHNGIRVQ
jgi:hypothetical protein